jgi:hypothetical protein
LAKREKERIFFFFFARDREKGRKIITRIVRRAPCSSRRALACAKAGSLLGQRSPA